MTLDEGTYNHVGVPVSFRNVETFPKFFTHRSLSCKLSLCEGCSHRNLRSRNTVSLKPARLRYEKLVHKDVVHQKALSGSRVSEKVVEASRKDRCKPRSQPRHLCKERYAFCVYVYVEVGDEISEGCSAVDNKRIT